MGIPKPALTGIKIPILQTQTKGPQLVKYWTFLSVLQKKASKLLKCSKKVIFSPLHPVAAELNINILKSSDLVGLKMTKYFSLEFVSPDGGVQEV